MMRIFTGVLLLATLLHACTKPVSIGTDFIDEDQINLVEVDTFSLLAKTIDPGAITLYDSVPSLTRYLAGNLSDPIFGNSSSQIFGQLRMAFPNVNFPDNATLDSVVLGLSYDSLFSYGNYLTEKIDVEVYRLTEDMQFEAEYDSDVSFMTESSPIGQKNNFIPQLGKKRVILVEVSAGEIDTVELDPQLRVRIDDAIGQEFLSYDSLTLANSDNFTDLFKGINVRINSNNSMIAFRLLSSNTNMTMYYKEADSIPRIFTLGFTSRSPVLPTFTHDFSAGSIDPFIGDYMLGDSLLFTQGMAGVEFEVEIPHISDVENSLVNHAQLSFTVAELPEDDLEVYPPVDQLTAVYQSPTNMDQNFLVSDAEAAEIESNSQAFIEEAFGGFISEEEVNGMTLRHYSMKITLQVAEMIAGDVPNSIKIRPRLKSLIADRSVIYGPGHSKYPMKLKLYLSTQ